ncbi:hypothetical protein H8N03_16030 [Ramlibacter sp. USB13]|uniref:Secretion system X translation initiation factor n=1 Tax=Ramlibacter cellulosilyticus TaxID=2764187 RepID=A0A923MRF6_9BURK|nr:hypothetical protein [Ramlibacter cellulosilyticus]MBC5784457.1 hypothetical protein [Ramlibacter cellulosilyticus]
MALSARTRWWAYGVAGLATVGAMQWVDQRAAEPEVVAAATPRRSTPVPAGAASAPADDTQVRLDWLKRRTGEDLPRGDPFGTQNMAVQQQQQAQAAAAPPPPPPPQAPPLPYTYLGKWIEQGQTTIYLARGEHHVAVRGPGRLDDTYTVESVNENQIVLNYVPLGIRQTLPLVPGAAPTQAAAGAAPPEESTEETN